MNQIDWHKQGLMEARQRALSRAAMAFKLEGGQVMVNMSLLSRIITEVINTTSGVCTTAAHDAVRPLTLEDDRMHV